MKKRMRDNAETLNNPDMRVRKIRALLGQHTFGISIARCSPDADKWFNRYDLSGGPIDVFKAITGIINK